MIYPHHQDEPAQKPPQIAQLQHEARQYTSLLEAELELEATSGLRNSRRDAYLKRKQTVESQRGQG